MSYTIDNVLIEGFKSNFWHEYQTQGVLQSTVRVEPQSSKTEHFPVYLALTSSNDFDEVTTLHQDTSYVYSEQNDRLISLRMFYRATLLSDFNRVRMLGDPKSAEAKALGYMAGRFTDTEILTAASGVAVTDNDATTDYDTDMTITSSGHAYSGSTTALNFDKVVGASTLLNAEGVPFGDRYLIVNSAGYRALRLWNATMTTDVFDSETRKTGQLPNVEGFQVVLCEQVPSGTAFYWHKEAMRMTVGTGGSLGYETFIVRNPSKKNEWDIAAQAFWGFSRMSEKGVGMIQYS